jgi:hypothetical protein
MFWKSAGMSVVVKVQGPSSEADLNQRPDTRMYQVEVDFRKKTSLSVLDAHSRSVPSTGSSFGSPSKTIISAGLSE